MIGTLVEFFPKCLRPPRPQLQLQRRIELGEHIGPDLELLAKLSIIPENGLECAGIAKLVKELAGQRRRAIRRGVRLPTVHFLGSALSVIHYLPKNKRRDINKLSPTFAIRRFTSLHRRLENQLSFLLLE